SATICAAMIGWAGSAAALSITNGSFETGDLTGWGITETLGGSAKVVTSAQARFGNTYTATDGRYMADLMATSFIQQNQTWSAGESISFDWAFLAMDLAFSFGPWEYYNDKALFEVIGANNKTVYSVTLADILSVGNYQDTGWQTFTYTFTTDGSGSIRFGVQNKTDTLNDSILLVDNVRSAAPVPEPTTMLLFGTGLLSLAAVGRRRTSKA
ncbi:MAG: PEP-CTERM sorting domain-containing protein, partial [Desulfobulbus sp.]|nr:PEP-CTERM sorting domain-containing protein [Desulfobulbus sp.]